jgi:MFS transporter, FSR family, fosmidomycin resistance protein
MTQATADLPVTGASAHETRIVVGVCAAHFVSHYYILILAPLFLFVREEYGVTYTELGLALTAFNVVSAVLQTPAGFLVDRIGARLVLIVGLVIGAVAFAVAGLVNSFWVFVAMFAVAGIGNTVYHPADYALLSQHVPAERIGRVYSFHTFAGMLGNAVAPASLLFLQTLVGWRGAFVAAGVLGLTVALGLALQGNGPNGPAPAAAKPSQDAAPAAVGWRLLLSTPILSNLVFFMLISMVCGGVYNFTVAALGTAFGTAPAIANTALSAMLLMSAIGVLAGGVLVGRTSRHALVAVVGLIVIAAMTFLIGLGDPGIAALILIMAVSGFFQGIIMPSRDMIVREVTPPGAFGTVFGFVTNGFSIAGMVAPLIYGQLMDHGHPRAIFFVASACALLSIVAVVFGRKKQQWTA